MNRPSFACLLACSFFTATPGWGQDEPVQQEITEPRQVILIVGDGMDEQQITIARNYLKGAAGLLLLDRMPQRATAQVLTTQDKVNGNDGIR